MMTRMMKDSGIEWIGEIPEGWEVNIIKFSTYVKGRIGWQGLKSDEFIEEGPFLVTGTDFIDGIINWDSCYHISEARYNEAPEIQLIENDLLITKDGTIGKIALVKNKPYEAILNSGIFVTRPIKNQYLTKYMYWVLNSSVFGGYIGFTETGSTIKHLYQETFENFKFPCPKINIQQFIANFLDKKCAEIDYVINAKQEQNKLLKDYRQSVIYEAVTKGLDKNVKFKDSGIEWIGKIPEDWDTCLVKRILSIKSGEFIKNDRPDDTNDFPIIGGNGIMGYTSNYNCENKTIVIGRVGALCGNVHLIDTKAWITDNALQIYNLEESICIEYLYLVLITMNLNQYASSTAQPLISGTLVKNLFIPMPNSITQQQIANYLDQKCNEIDRIINSNNDMIEKLKEYRQSLIYEAVTGKIEV